MSKLHHAIVCTTCRDRGWLLDENRREKACPACAAGQQVQADLDVARSRKPKDRTDQIRLLVDELAHSWTDPDEDKHAGLVVLVAVHLEPVHMEARSGGKHAKVTGSPSPVADDVGDLISDMTVGVIAHEQALRILLGHHRTIRSGSLRSLIASLDAIPDLWAAAHAKRSEHWLLAGEISMRQGKARRMPGGIERDLRRWHRECRRLLGAERRWSRVPTTCSVCDLPALRQNPRDGSVRCTSCGELWTEQELGWLDNVTKEQA